MRPRGPHRRVRAPRVAAAAPACGAIGVLVVVDGPGGVRPAWHQADAPGDVGAGHRRRDVLLRRGGAVAAGAGHGVPQERGPRPVGDADAGAGARGDPPLRPDAVLPPQGGVPPVVRLLVLQERRRAVQERGGRRRGARRRGVPPPVRRVQRRRVLDRPAGRQAWGVHHLRRHRQRGAVRAREAGDGRDVHRRRHVGVLPVQWPGQVQVGADHHPARQDRAAHRRLGALHAPRQQLHRRAHGRLLLAAQRRAVGGRVRARVHRGEQAGGVLLPERPRQLPVPGRVPAGVGGARDRHPERRGAERAGRGFQRQVQDRGGGVPRRGRRGGAAVAQLHEGVGADGGVQVEAEDGADDERDAPPAEEPRGEDAEQAAQRAVQGGGADGAQGEEQLGRGRAMVGG